MEQKGWEFSRQNCLEKSVVDQPNEYPQKAMKPHANSTMLKQYARLADSPAPMQARATRSTNKQMGMQANQQMHLMYIVMKDFTHNFIRKDITNGNIEELIGGYSSKQVDTRNLPCEPDSSP